MAKKTAVPTHPETAARLQKAASVVTQAKPTATLKKAATRTTKPRVETQETFGVVAYTKGSRFTDAQVMAAVKRVLSQT